MQAGVCGSSDPEYRRAWLCAATGLGDFSYVYPWDKRFGLGRRNPVRIDALLALVAVMLDVAEINLSSHPLASRFQAQRFTGTCYRLPQTSTKRPSHFVSPVAYPGASSMCDLNYSFGRGGERRRASLA